MKEYSKTKFMHKKYIFLIILLNACTCLSNDSLFTITSSQIVLSAGVIFGGYKAYNMWDHVHKIFLPADKIKELITVEPVINGKVIGNSYLSLSQMEVKIKKIRKKSHGKVPGLVNRIVITPTEYFNYKTHVIPQEIQKFKKYHLCWMLSDFSYVTGVLVLSLSYLGYYL